MKIMRLIVSRRIKWKGHIPCLGQMRNASTILDWKRERKGRLERPRHWYKINITTDIETITSARIGFIWLKICLLWALKRKIPSSGMWRRVDLVWTDVSEERIASIFRVEKSVSEEPEWASGADRPATCSRWFFAREFFYSEDGGDMFLRNVGSHKIYTAPHPTRRHSS
jgi:hypothetical protein